ncbi:MAG: GxxExxY protein [Bacteroidales bacterium]|nr:GxxExxY protein [Bacteroidales bacterium]MCQ2755042.1 GxxExxY protein [bacterium]
MDLLYKEEVYEIIGACLAVHRELGKGFLEAVYQEALEIELQNNFIDYEREKELTIFYKGIELKKKYYADFFCYNKIIVELKATSSLLPEHEAQLLNYLKVTKKRVGLLINFGEQSLKYKRFIL